MQKIEAKISFTSNEHSDTPTKIILELEKETIDRIELSKFLVKKHNLTSIKIDVYIEQLLDDDGDEVDWRLDVSELIVSSHGIYVYAQNKYDAGDQIESENIEAMLELKEYAEPHGKALITVEGGIVQSVCSDHELKYVVVDYDDQGDEPVIVGEINDPDMVISTGEKFYSEVFKGKLHNSEKTAKRKLKKLNF